MNWLKGKKTYIIAALMLIVQGLQMSGTITPELANELLKLLGMGAVATVAAKMNRVDKQVGDK